TEVMGSTNQRVSGSSSNKTLGQDQIADVGAQIREGGNLDRVREWMIDQSMKEGEILKQYSNAQLHLQITPRDFSDPQTGQRIETQWVEFMTERHPLPLRHSLQGEFDYDVNVYEAQKINKPNLRRELSEAILTASNPQVRQDMLEKGKRIRTDILVEKWGENFEMINLKDFVETLDPEQQAAIQASQVLQQTGGVVPEQLGGVKESVETQPQEQTA
ncbi:MAG: hypothetical protein QQN63_10235, partial [Nitrosopumilus sp.]